jgi:S1-C subfamily serine protease
MIEQQTGQPQGQADPDRNRLRYLLERRRGIALLSLGLVVSALAFFLFNERTPKPELLTPEQVEEIVVQALASATAPPAVSAEVYQTILPSLVVIKAEPTDDKEENGFRVGSGVIINFSGEVLTALHIVEGTNSIQVQFADGSESNAIVSITQPENDIAVLVPEIPPSVFIPATLGSSGAMRIGDNVFAVGHPLGLAGSMSAGVISGFDRSYTPIDTDQKLEGLIQFDAAVNPGNSGGPLLNRSGQVIGIVTGLVNPTEQEVFIGIGFAVPISVAAGAAGSPAQ